MLFLDLHGWRHRLTGGFLLLWLLVGVWWTVSTSNSGVQNESNVSHAQAPHFSSAALAYDVVLGILGIITTLTASMDFPHKTIQNAPGQSGTLSQNVMVTQGEMVEHAFYQGLNLMQAVFLHLFASQSSAFTRGLGLVLVTLPWWFRRRFPVNSFSENYWTKTPASQRTSTETFLYGLKKAQYLFYKHVILHGLNISLFVYPVAQHASPPSWRVFWLCLNASYVLEFFLQSLVRRRVLAQSTMLMLSRSLMVVSSVAAVNAVFLVVRWELCAASFLANLVHRYHDVTNTHGLAALAWGITHHWGNL